MNLFGDKKIIIYGYGEAFHIVKQFLKMDIEYIIDNDVIKHGYGEHGLVKPLEEVNSIDFIDKIIFVFPFKHQEITKQLIQKGAKSKQIVYLKELLNNNQKFKKQYLYIRRVTREEKIDYNNIDLEKLYKKWFSQPALSYRGVNLIELMASDIAIILDYMYCPQVEVDLYWHPSEESYTVYGEGTILYPMFVRGRNDYYKRLETITSDIDDMKIITYSDVNLKWTSNFSKKKYTFKYEHKVLYDETALYLLEKFEQMYIKLKSEEKKWLDYCIKFYMCCIDFYLDILKIEFNVLVSFLPYYGEENILKQLSDNSNAKSVYYQHGYHLHKEKFSKVCDYILLFTSKSNYYLLWDEETKQIFIVDLNVEESNIYVLGMPFLSQKKQYKKIMKSFVVICPGEIVDNHKIIADLINDALTISEKFNLSFTVRYHPLNIKNIDIHSKLYKGIVNIENFDVNDYDFAIGTMSTLLAELDKMGLTVYGRNLPAWPGNYNSSSDLAPIVDLFYKSFKNKEVVHQDLVNTNMYQEFVLNLTRLK